MRCSRMKWISAAAVTALLVTPTMAAAAAPATAPQSGWTALSQLTPAGATALASTGVTAGSPTAATLSAAQSSVAVDEPRANPLPLPVIAVLLAVLGTAIYIAFIEDDDDGGRVFLTSPD